MNNPLNALRHHVTGAIERGEGVAIVELPVQSVDLAVVATSIHRSGMALSIRRKDKRQRAGEVNALRLVAIDLAATVGARDPQFNRDQFLAACGVQS